MPSLQIAADTGPPATPVRSGAAAAAAVPAVHHAEHRPQNAA
jgi:hypothetical protein